MAKKLTRKELEELYRRYNKRELVHPDPLEFLYHYDYCDDREIVALIAASLAYGRVAQILASVKKVLKELGPRPAQFLEKTSAAQLRKLFKTFKHRFTTGEEMSSFLINIKKAQKKHVSLEACFKKYVNEQDETFMPALSKFVRELRGKLEKNSLLPAPEKGSACKRLNLFLRWMVRQDDVDPGCWQTLDPAKLVIPLDTHMHQISLALGLTKRKGGDLRTAIEITKAFGKFCPEDPVRYDFALTRMGIRDELDVKKWLHSRV